MNLEEEIHAINKKLGDLVTTVTLVKERRNDDKENSENLTEQVKDLAIAVNRLNLTIGRKDGVQEGKTYVMKWVWTIFGSAILGWVLWVTTSVITCNTNDKILMEKHSKKTTK